MPQQYAQNIEKLIWNEAFRKWVLQPTPESDAFWFIWQVSNPDRVDDLKLARTVVASLQVRDRQLPEADLQQLISQTLALAKNEPSIQPVRLATRSFRWQTLGWAALILLVASFSWIVWQYPSFTQKPLTYQTLTKAAPVALIERVNDTRQLLEIRLSDHSTVWLKPQARISYPSAFLAAKREVYLTGEAIFTVSRDPQRPFYVYSDEIITKVGGTRFIVRSVSDETEVKVIVQTGKVSVFARQDDDQTSDHSAKGVVLTPNQQVIFSRKEDRFQKSLVKKPVAIQAIRPGSYFVYDETPITDVFSQLELVYGINIGFDRTMLKPCTVTATLDEGGFFEKLGAVCRAIGASYTVLDGQIVVSGPGCGRKPSRFSHHRRTFRYQNIP